MAVLEWDKVGDRVYQSGIDRGVLYLKDGTTVPWNGLTSVEDDSDTELKSYYLDGVKILDHVVPGDYQGKLTAFTYPEEFNSVLGILSVETGVSFHEQRSQSFNLSYRTKIGNDLDADYGYRIHLLYNLLAIPDSQTFQSLDDQPSANQFSWTLTGTPFVGTIDGIRPTVHISIDSVNSDSTLFSALEDILYGTAVTAPRFPTTLEVRVMFGEVGALYIIDNGDGTWTAIDPSDDFITANDGETFVIDHADATYIIPADTYTIEDTPVPLL